MNEEKIEKRNNMFHSPFYNAFLLVSEHANTGDKKALAYISSFYNWEVLKEVVKWMTELAEQGDMDAQYNLGIHYQQMLDGNDKETIKWFTKAAENGCIPACWHLGMSYEFGIWGVDKNIEEAIKWYKMVANSGEESVHDAELKLEKLTDLNSNN